MGIRHRTAARRPHRVVYDVLGAVPRSRRLLAARTLAASDARIARQARRPARTLVVRLPVSPAVHSRSRLAALARSRVAAPAAPDREDARRPARDTGRRRRTRRAPLSRELHPLPVHAARTLRACAGADDRAARRQIREPRAVRGPVALGAAVLPARSRGRPLAAARRSRALCRPRRTTDRRGRIGRRAARAREGAPPRDERPLQRQGRGRHRARAAASAVAQRSRSRAKARPSSPSTSISRAPNAPRC